VAIRPRAAQIISVTRPSLAGAATHAEDKQLRF